MRQATVAAGLVAGLVGYIGRQGRDGLTLAARAGIADGSIGDPDARLPLGAYIDLLRLAQAELDDPALALNWASSVGMHEVSIVGLIMEASANMGEAFAQMQRYGRLAIELDDGGSGPRFALQPVDGKLLLVDRRARPEAVPELTEETFARLVCGPRRFLPQPHVLAVHVTHAAPAYRQVYDRVFQCPVHFDADVNALELHPEVAHWPVARNPRYVFGLLCERGDALLAQAAAAAGMRGRLEDVLLPRLHMGDPGADALAGELGCSRSTLFRRLREEGTSYAQVLDGLRRNLALQYLRGGRVSVNEVAYLVGFSEPAAFSRAFRRWTGQAPGRFRHSAKI